jgi:DNA-binding winged helix-turn-helix (wHTH) protein/Flp pilus assembly protein TadD
MPTSHYRIGSYLIDFKTGLAQQQPSGSDSAPTVEASQETSMAVRIEPKACAVLQVLCDHHQQLVSKERLIEQVWSDVVVSDDALLRCISRLRKVFNDDPKTPAYIETVPKRGYRLIAEVEALPISPAPTPASKAKTSELYSPPELHIDQAVQLAQAKAQKSKSLRTTGLIGAVAGMVLMTFFARERDSNDTNTLTPMPTSQHTKPATTEPSETYTAVVQRADNFYHQIRRADNEMAISLYEQGMALRPQGATAQAGLANALVQKTLRWNPQVSEITYPNLGSAVEAGVFQSDAARPAMERALALAEHAVRLEPNSVRSRKALGFVLTALGRYDDAMVHYQRALELDPHAWQVLINSGEISDLRQQPQQALAYYERAYHAMTERYQRDIAQIRPWYADMGTVVGKRYAEAGQLQVAELWYRGVLNHSPLHVEATLGLAQLLATAGDKNQARRLCTSLNQRLGSDHACRY